MLPIKPVDSPLYVVAVISNPVRYRSRYHLYREFEKYITDAGAVLYTVELAFGDRDFEITDAANPCHVQIRTEEEIWYKENMINVGVSRLPSDWKYVAWIDADVTFARHDIVEETIHQLQHYPIVQMFSHSQDVGPQYQPLAIHKGFVYQWYAHQCQTPDQMERYDVWHSGYAWACRRDAWDAMGGLIDWAILGSADRYMACAWVGEMHQALQTELHEHCPTYTQWAMAFQERCERSIRRNIGYVPGLVLHFFHGKKSNRGYQTRSATLWKTKFDPALDLHRDWQGVLKLNPTKLALRDGLRAYFRSRNEDGTEL